MNLLHSHELFRPRPPACYVRFFFWEGKKHESEMRDRVYRADSSGASQNTKYHYLDPNFKLVQLPIPPSADDMQRIESQFDTGVADPVIFEDEKGRSFTVRSELSQAYDPHDINSSTVQYEQLYKMTVAISKSGGEPFVALLTRDEPTFNHYYARTDCRAGNHRRKNYRTTKKVLDRIYAAQNGRRTAVDIQEMEFPKGKRDEWTIFVEKDAEGSLSVCQQSSEGQTGSRYLLIGRPLLIVVLDLDHTLVHRPDGRTPTLQLRPHCEEFLNFLQGRDDVEVWISTLGNEAHYKIVASALELGQRFPNMRFKYRTDELTKTLDFFSNLDGQRAYDFQEDVLIVDDSPAVWVKDQDKVLPVPPFSWYPTEGSLPWDDPTLQHVQRLIEDILRTRRAGESVAQWLRTQKAQLLSGVTLVPGVLGSANQTEYNNLRTNLFNKSKDFGATVLPYERYSQRMRSSAGGKRAREEVEEGEIPTDETVYIVTEHVENNVWGEFQDWTRKVSTDWLEHCILWRTKLDVTSYLLHSWIFDAAVSMIDVEELRTRYNAKHRFITRYQSKQVNNVIPHKSGNDGNGANLSVVTPEERLRWVTNMQPDPIKWRQNLHQSLGPIGQQQLLERWTARPLLAVVREEHESPALASL